MLRTREIEFYYTTSAREARKDVKRGRILSPQIREIEDLQAYFLGVTDQGELETLVKRRFGG